MTLPRSSAFRHRHRASHRARHPRIGRRRRPPRKTDSMRSCVRFRPTRPGKALRGRRSSRPMQRAPCRRHRPQHRPAAMLRWTRSCRKSDPSRRARATLRTLRAARALRHRKHLPQPRRSDRSRVRRAACRTPRRTRARHLRRSANGQCTAMTARPTERRREPVKGDPIVADSRGTAASIRRVPKACDTDVAIRASICPRSWVIRYAPPPTVSW